MNITVYQNQINDAAFLHFRELMMDRELCYLASDLYAFGLDDAHDLNDAIIRAISVCKAVGIPVRANFKMVFTSRDGAVYCDWKLSSLGRKLLILNANPNNPFVAKMQIKLLKLN
jgi:hypothetical protein